MRTTRLAAALACGILAAGCFDDDVQVGDEGAGGSGGAGGAADPVWSCLGQAPEQVPGGVGVSLKVINAPNRQPRADAVVQPCSQLDYGCDTPLAGEQAVNASGNVTVPVPADFAGYFLIRSSSADPDNTFVTTRARAIRRGSASEALLPREVNVWRPADLELLAAIVGLRYDPTKSLLMVTARNCEGTPAAGVSFVMSTGGGVPANTAQVYTNDQGLPDLNVHETSPDGIFFALNVDPGVVNFSATVNALQQPLGSTNVVLNEGVVTVVLLEP